jgi:hypothetical protein
MTDEGFTDGTIADTDWLGRRHDEHEAPVRGWLAGST